MKVAQNTKARETRGAISGLSNQQNPDWKNNRSKAVSSSPDKGKEGMEEKPED